MIYEDIINTEKPGRYYTLYTSRLGNLSIIQFDPAGTQIASFTVPKYQFKIDYSRNILYNADLKTVGRDNFTYMSTGNNNFILMNYEPVADIEKAKKNEKWPQTKDAVERSNGVYYILKGKDSLACNKIVFINPVKSGYEQGYFYIYDYDAVRNIYVTIKMERRDKEYNARLLWVQP